MLQAWFWTFSSSEIFPFCFQIINNYLDRPHARAMDGASPSVMHFRDSKRKVDYVLAYHYRKRTSHHHPSGGSLGGLHRPVNLAVVSNGETGKSHGEEQPQQNHDQNMPQQQPDQAGVHVIELSPLDALEEEKQEQREEYERNLMEAGLEIEKDIEVRGQGAFPQCSTGLLTGKMLPEFSTESKYGEAPNVAGVKALVNTLGQPGLFFLAFLHKTLLPRPEYTVVV